MPECMFCKRNFTRYSFNINSSLENGVYPYKDLNNLFGNLDLTLSDTRQICLLCLCVVRTLNEFKHIMLGALEPDTENQLSLVLAFEEFKRQVSMVPFEAESDDQIDKYKAQEYAHETQEVRNHYVEEDRNDDENELLVEMYSVDFHQSEDSSFSRACSPTSREVKIFNEGKKTRGKRGRKKSECKTDASLNYDDEYPTSKRSRSAVTSQGILRGPSSIGSSILRYDENHRLKNKSTRCVNRLRCEEAALLSEKEDNETQVLYRCLLSVCSQQYENFDDLLGHVVSEHGIEENDLTYSDYQERLKEFVHAEQSKIKFKLKYKTNMPDNSENKYPCLVKYCQMSYLNINDLTKHKVDGHQALAKFWCSECKDAKFACAEDLSIHNKAVHSKINSYCVYCSQPLYNMDDLFYHLENHKLYCYPCKYCDKFFLDFKSLRDHRKIHDKEPDKVRIRRATKHTIIERTDIENSDNESCLHDENTAIDFNRVRLQTLQMAKIQPTEIETSKNLYGFHISDDEYVITKKDRDTSDESTCVKIFPIVINTELPPCDDSPHMISPKKIVKLGTGCESISKSVEPLVSMVELVDNTPNDNLVDNTRVDNVAYNTPTEILAGSTSTDNFGYTVSFGTSVDNKPTDNLVDNTPTDNLADNTSTDNLEYTESFGTSVDNIPTDNLVDNKPIDNLVDTKPTDNFVHNKPTDSFLDNKYTDNSADNISTNNIVDTTVTIGNLMVHTPTDTLVSNNPTSNLIDNAPIDNFANDMLIDKLAIKVPVEMDVIQHLKKPTNQQKGNEIKKCVVLLENYNALFNLHLQKRQLMEAQIELFEEGLNLDESLSEAVVETQPKILISINKEKQQAIPKASKSSAHSLNQTIDQTLNLAEETEINTTTQKNSAEFIAKEMSSKNVRTPKKDLQKAYSKIPYPELNINQRTSDDGSEDGFQNLRKNRQKMKLAKNKPKLMTKAERKFAGTETENVQSDQCSEEPEGNNQADENSSTIHPPLTNKDNLNSEITTLARTRNSGRMHVAPADSLLQIETNTDDITEQVWEVVEEEVVVFAEDEHIQEEIVTEINYENEQIIPDFEQFESFMQKKTKKKTTLSLAKKSTLRKQPSIKRASRASSKISRLNSEELNEKDKLTTETDQSEKSNKSKRSFVEEIVVETVNPDDLYKSPTNIADNSDNIVIEASSTSRKKRTKKMPKKYKQEDVVRFNETNAIEQSEVLKDYHQDTISGSSAATHSDDDNNLDNAPEFATRKQAQIKAKSEVKTNKTKRMGMTDIVRKVDRSKFKTTKEGPSLRHKRNIL